MKSTHYSTTSPSLRCPVAADGNHHQNHMFLLSFSLSHLDWIPTLRHNHKSPYTMAVYLPFFSFFLSKVVHEVPAQQGH